MTKKDYIAIAGALNHTLEVTREWGADRVAASEATLITYNTLVGLFTLDNERFQEETFRKAVFDKTA